MTETDARRKELDRLIVSKDFKLTDSEVIHKALEFENNVKNMDLH